MSKVVKLGMIFDGESAPDFGDISLDKTKNAFFILTSESLPKLTGNLTRSVCGVVFNIPTGAQAFVVDTGDVLIYHPDAWHYVKRNIRTEKKYGDLTAVITKNGKNYILGDNEKIIISVIGGNTTVISKEMYLTHYRGQGIYAYHLNMEDAHKLADLESYSMQVKVFDGETDITSTLTIESVHADEWYDLHIKYDTGV